VSATPQIEEFLIHIRQELEPLISRACHVVPDEPPGFRDYTTSYLQRPGKQLRPALVCLAAGACGGEEAARRALPAAAAVEILHVMTLVHDDIIDEDPRRRGGPSVHAGFEDQGRRELALPADPASRYGKNMALLAGDALHAAAIWILVHSGPQYGIPQHTVHALIARLEGETFPALIAGQALDLRLGMQALADLTGSPEKLARAAQRVNHLKTASLLAFSAAAGARIGLQTDTWTHPWVQSLETFAARCGTAFQIQDDLLGICGDATLLGKPVGSDLREGKKTLLLAELLPELSEEQRRRLAAEYGRPDLSGAHLEAWRRLFAESRAARRLAEEADSLIRSARESLDCLPPGRFRQLLQQWADLLRRRQR